MNITNLYDYINDEKAKILIKQDMEIMKYNINMISNIINDSDYKMYLQRFNYNHKHLSNNIINNIYDVDDYYRIKIDYIIIYSKYKYNK